MIKANVVNMRHYYFLFTILFIFGTSVIAQQKKYDVAAYVWPAYHNEPRFQKEMNIFHDGKGEWEAVYSQT